MTRGALEALLTLLATPGLGELGATQLLRQHGSPERALRALRRRGTDRAEVARGGTRGPMGERVAHALQVCAALDVQVLLCTDAAYPALPIEMPPPALFARGDLGLLDAPMAAVVGTRACTEYGIDVAREIGRGLARAGAVVVSGLARGVDGAAHAAALEADGGTVAVLGCGIDVCYPPEHHGLQEAIARRGLLLSQFFPGAPPLRDHFTRRNRVIAGLARLAVIVEAPYRSGALSTARWALDQGAEIFAVPGPIGRETSAGTLALLRDGAHVYTELADLLLPLGLQPVAEAPVVAAAGAGGEGGGDEPAHAPLRDALARDARHVDVIARAVAAPEPRVLAALLELELDGFAEQLPGMRFRRRA